MAERPVWDTCRKGTKGILFPHTPVIAKVQVKKMYHGGAWEPYLPPQLINEIKDYFLAEIKERELNRKNLSKYVASLNYFDKSLNVVSILSGSISIASLATIIGAPAVIIGASCGFTFSITSGLVRKFLKATRNKKKKQ